MQDTGHRNEHGRRGTDARLPAGANHPGNRGDVCDRGSTAHTLDRPPPGLFDRIEEAAAIPVVTAPVVVEYSIDANDVVVSTGGDWSTFAMENDGEDVAEQGAGLDLWSQIEGEDARSVWQLVVSEVRRSDAAAVIPFRCDGPGVRRWYEIDVSPGNDGSVDFRSHLVFEESRPEVVLVARGARREAVSEPVHVCCWCARGRHGDAWLPIDELVWRQHQLEDEPVPEIVQGICGECSSSMSAEAQALAGGN